MEQSSIMTDETGATAAPGENPELVGSGRLVDEAETAVNGVGNIAVTRDGTRHVYPSDDAIIASALAEWSPRRR